MGHRRRNAVADANQRNRDLANKLHALDQEIVLPLRARVAELERENQHLAGKLKRLERLEHLYRDASKSALRLVNELLDGGK